MAAELSTTLARKSPDIGDRVILADVQDRSQAVLGTVIDCDPYRDRGTIVEVLHEDGTRRWRRRPELRRLGHRMARADLAADLVDRLGDRAPAWTQQSEVFEGGDGG
jgi:hypothetical protein